MANMTIRFSLGFFYLLVGVLTLGCQHAEEESERQGAQDKIFPVKTLTVNANADYVTRQFTGRVKAVQTIDLSFQVAGKLHQLHFNEGSIVPKGELLAELDSHDFILRQKEARVDVERLTKALKRQKNLLNKKATSQEIYDRTEAELKLAHVALENADQNYKYHRIYAPFDALMTRRLTENFHNINVGQPIVRVQDLSEIRIEISVTQKQLATIKPENLRSITASFEFLPGKTFPLTYRKHQTEADSVTQTYITELAMTPVKDVRLLPGMSASVETIIAQPQANTFIPVTSLVADENSQYFVWLISKEDARITRQAVEVGAMQGEYVEITQGLSSNMEIVAAGVNRLFDGAKVKNYLAEQ